MYFIILLLTRVRIYHLLDKIYLLSFFCLSTDRSQSNSALHFPHRFLSALTLDLSRVFVGNGVYSRSDFFGERRELLFFLLVEILA